MKIYIAISLSLFLVSCSSNDASSPAPAKSLPEAGKVPADLAQPEDTVEVMATDVHKGRWTTEEEFMSELASKEYSQHGDEFHEHLHFNYEYSDLMELLNHKSTMVRSYAIYATRRYFADTLFQIAHSVRDDTGQVVAKWEGASDIHINCYSIAQLAAQSLIWYEIKGQLTPEQKNEMEDQMESDLPPISDECGVMMSVNR